MKFLTTLIAAACLAGVERLEAHRAESSKRLRPRQSTEE